MRRTHPAWTLTLLASLFAAPAITADEPPPLAGPRVTDKSDAPKDKPTLVQREFDGRVRALSNSPVAAALEKLDLDDAARLAAQSVLDARNAAMDQFVRDHLAELALLKNARDSGDKETFRKDLLSLLRAAKPITDKGPLVAQVAAVLPAPQASELRKLVTELSRARIADRMDGTTADSAATATRPGPLQATIAENLGNFGEEIKAAYERTIKSKAGELQQLSKALGLTPEQEAKVQQEYIDLFQKSGGKPTRLQKLGVFTRIYRELDADQRAKFTQYIRAERGQAKSTEPAGESLPVPKSIPTPPAPKPGAE